MSFMIRPARENDRDKVAPLVYIASKSHLSISPYDVLFDSTKDRTVEFIKKLFVAENRSWFHWSHCLVAEVDKDVGATITGYSEKEAGIPVFAKALREVTGWGEKDFDAFAKRTSSLMKVKPENLEDAWIVEHVATYPNYRHMGLMKALFEAVLEKGRKRGFTRAQITFVIGNDPAQSLYEENGFRHYQEFMDLEFQKLYGAPGFRTYIKQL